MYNKKDFQTRKLPTTLDGMLFVTLRVSQSTTGNGQLIYQGYAFPGSNEQDAVWLIQRTTIGNDDTVVTLFANGEAKFDQVWANHTQLNYA
ncbi:hypothetical protein [Candidatus Magnetaquicoccus inordinatus]|uniref:hypothetical protein n=1 Tax=Candidatus Magnetaquicoccus inordinatus TaxID=2496818 RepID=UPI00102ABDBE|nr:hypothetical protein [Candidatus Magnetaquicoccus inordinatus]